MTGMTSQKNRILRHLKDYGHINPMQAMQEYGVMRLASRISDLKQDGIGIGSKWIHGKNRYGEKTKYKEYFLVGESANGNRE